MHMHMCVYSYTPMCICQCFVAHMIYMCVHMYMCTYIYKYRCSRFTFVGIRDFPQGPALSHVCILGSLPLQYLFGFDGNTPREGGEFRANIRGSVNSWHSLRCEAIH